MFNFSTFISLLVAIIAIYIPLIITLKKELEDLKITPETNKEKIINRQNKIKFINILCLSLVIIIILFYQYTTICTKVKSLVSSNIFIIIKNFFYSILPFKLGVLRHPNYRFSYIVGAILCIVIEYIICIYFKTIIKSKSFIRILRFIIALIIFTWGLIWCNHFISLFLAFSIIHYFEFFSIFFNFLAYLIIGIIISLLLFFFDTEKNITNIKSDTKE